MFIVWAYIFIYIFNDFFSFALVFGSPLIGAKILEIKDKN